MRAISRTIRTFSATVQRRRARFLTAPTRRPPPSALILAICPTPARYHYDELIILFARDANPWASATRFQKTILDLLDECTPRADNDP